MCSTVSDKEKNQMMNTYGKGTDECYKVFVRGTSYWSNHVIGFFKRIQPDGNIIATMSSRSFDETMFIGCKLATKEDVQHVIEQLTMEQPNVKYRVYEPNENIYLKLNVWSHTEEDINVVCN